jgi:hypothetical protein
MDEPADGSAGEEGAALVEMESSNALDEDDPSTDGSVGEEGTALVDTTEEEVIRGERERERGGRGRGCFSGEKMI